MKNVALQKLVSSSPFSQTQREAAHSAQIKAASRARFRLHKDEPSHFGLFNSAYRRKKDQTDTRFIIAKPAAFLVIGLSEFCH